MKQLQRKQLDFTGQIIFCGVDVHKKSWKVSIRLNGMELRTFSQNPSANELLQHLKSNYPGARYKVVYEAGFSGFSHQRILMEQGIDCMVVHPADVPTKDKEKKRKSDTVDCRKLSKSLSEGSIQGIHIPTEQQQNDRGVVRAYHQMVKDQTRSKNRIKSWLDFQGIPIANNQQYRHWSKNFLLWLNQLSLSAEARISLDLLLQSLEQNRQLVLLTTRQLRILSRQERYKEDIRLLRTVRGIGQITALSFITEIGNISRFKNFASLCDYLGLVPKVHSSGEKEYVRGLSRRGNRQLRNKLIEASWVAIRLDPALTMAYTNYCKRMKANKAIIRIARKLLSRIYFVMKNKKEYVNSIVE